MPSLGRPDTPGHCSSKGNHIHIFYGCCSPSRPVQGQEGRVLEVTSHHHSIGVLGVNAIYRPRQEAAVHRSDVKVGDMHYTIAVERDREVAESNLHMLQHSCAGSLNRQKRAEKRANAGISFKMQKYRAESRPGWNLHKQF